MSIPVHSLFLSQAEWLRHLSEVQPVRGKCSNGATRSNDFWDISIPSAQIGLQPSTWLHSGELMQSRTAELRDLVQGISCLSLSGSGSSEYPGDCARAALRRSLGINVETVPAGALLTHGRYALPVGKPSCMVSLARSGDSP